MPGAVHNDPWERGKRDMAPWNSPIPPHVRHGVPALAPEHAAIVDLCRNNSCRSAVVGKEALTIALNCPRLCGQYKKEPLVGKIEF